MFLFDYGYILISSCHPCTKSVKKVSIIFEEKEKMLTTIKGVYDHGKIILSEDPPVKEMMSDVIITFLPLSQSNGSKPKRVLGGLENRISVPDDFNEPLDDLKEYL